MLSDPHFVISAQRRLGHGTVQGFLCFPVADDALEVCATETHGSDTYVKYIFPGKKTVFFDS